ncbi:protein SUPPRESSOR OF npr1-1, CONSTITUTIVE 1 [Cryptomeria japonica]|uniref:protein SUPPRESSOR OF npr1-1, CONSTITUTIVE 1 n=1 Tax=Cryptomeria japonica TaxID=3369 RepID=UPI0027DA51BD|nr:protein SUPPRESSOR OF npr1-1, CONSTITUTIVE 1 [Cryptomeria japonica]
MDILNKSNNSPIIVTTRDAGVLITAGIAAGYNLKGMDRHNGRELFCWHAFDQPNHSSSIAERVWEGSGWNGQHALETLKDKCLVELEGIKNDELRMHDHLRDLGREMAPEFGPPHRLWRPADLKYLELGGFKKILAKTDVRCFHSIFDKSMDSHITFFLGQSDICFDTLPSLLWLQLDGSSKELPSIPSWIPLQNLRYLKIHFGQFKTLWENSRQAPSHLKELLISQTSLKEFPNFSEISDSLENVFLENKGKSGTSDLTNLVLLNITDCPEFVKFCLWGMKCLQRITFHRNVKVKYFVLVGCPNLKKVCFGYEKLIKLSIRDCPELEKLSDFRGSSCLERIIIDGSRKLHCLRLVGCQNLKSVSGNFELIELFINDYPKLEELPCFARVEQIEIYSCEKLQNIILPRTLIRLSLLRCRELKRVPGIGDHMKLTELTISECLELEEFSSLSRLSCLEKIEIDSCEKLQNITLPTTLISLTLICCKELQGMAGIDDLTKLTRLIIRQCAELEELPSLSRLSYLEDIEIDSCEKLQNITLPTALEVIAIGDLTKLRELIISECPKLRELPNLATLSCLKKFEINHCEKIDNIMLPTTIISLSVRSCRDLQRVAGTADLTKLTKLYINDCPKLEELRSLASVSCLKWVVIKSCEKFVPSDYILVIGKAVDGAESTLNEYLFSDADLGIQAVTEIGTHKTALKEMSAIGCTVIIVDSCTLVEDINKSLHIAPLIMAAQLNCVRENG